MNKGFISGRIVSEPEFKETQNSNLISFQIVNNDKSVKKADGGYEQIGQFFWIKYWNKTGKMKEHIWKGQEVSVEYELEQDTWTDASTGNKRSALRILATRVEPHHWSRPDQKQDAARQTESGSAFDDDGIPFD